MNPTFARPNIYPPAAPRRRRRIRAFSLVEVTTALGLVAFVVIAVLGLLSMGINSNRVSLEETRGAFILTLLEADLRNSLPNAQATSTTFNLPLPYALDDDENRILNPAVQAGTFQTLGLDSLERPAALAAGTHVPYQASVVYTKVPAAGQLEAIQARLIVNWPGRPASTALAVTDPDQVSGFVEAFVTFPAP